MISADGTTVARFDGRTKGLVYLVEMDFRTAPVYFNTSGEDIDIDGRNYLGRGALVDFPRIQESEDSANAKFTLGVTLINQAMLAATIGDATEYRLKKIRVYLQLMNEKFQADGQKMLRWRGYMDKISVEVATESESVKGRLKLECTKAGQARARRYEGLRLTQQQHRMAHPTDRGLDYLQELVNTPAPWLTVEFQKQ